MNDGKIIEPSIFYTDPLTGKLIPIPLGWSNKRERRKRGASDLKPLSEMKFCSDITPSNNSNKFQEGISSKTTTNFKVSEVKRASVRIPAKNMELVNSLNIQRKPQNGTDINSNYNCIDREHTISSLKQITLTHNMAFAEFKTDYYSNLCKFQRILAAEEIAFAAYENTHQKNMQSLQTILQNSSESGIDLERSKRRSKSIESSVEPKPKRENMLLESTPINSDLSTPRTGKALDLYNSIRHNNNGFKETPNLNRNNTPQSSDLRSLSLKVQKQCFMLHHD